MAERPPFTPLGEPELEHRIAADLDGLVRAVQGELGSSCRALLLGGGYGRGEGGGHRDRAGTWRPLNDYDLVAIVGGVPRWRLAAWRRRLAALALRQTAALGIEVELSPLRAEELPHVPFTLMWTELLAAPFLLAGDPAVLAAVRSLPPDGLPALEAVRYLANRGALLLWSRTESLPAERVWKFVAKAWLACGAATLIARRRFVVGYAARQRALEALPAEALPAVSGLVERHRAALAERLTPTAPPAGLAGEVASAVAGLLSCWRWSETLRTGWAAPSWEAYAARGGLFPESPWRRPELLLRHLRLLGLRGVQPWSATAEHPRARILRALPAALAGESAPTAAQLVGGTVEGTSQRCLHLWRRVQA